MQHREREGHHPITQIHTSTSSAFMQNIELHNVGDAAITNNNLAHLQKFRLAHYILDLFFLSSFVSNEDFCLHKTFLSSAVHTVVVILFCE